MAGYARLGIAAGAALLLGLASAATPAAFEVASVRPSARRPADTKSGGRHGGGSEFRLLHRRLLATDFNLFGLIVKAYGLTACRPLGGADCALLSGGPAWIRKQGFDIAAKMPDSSPEYTLAQLEQGRAPQFQWMLQALLAERFHLRVHRETRVIPVFLLTAGRNGPKVRKAAASEQPLVAFRPLTQADGRQAIQLLVRNSPLQDLAGLYSKFLERPVVDRTGLTARYDFTVEYEADPDAPGPFSAATGPALFRALQEQAGLKLQSARAPVEVLVVDHAEYPSGN